MRIDGGRSAARWTRRSQAYQPLASRSRSRLLVPRRSSRSFRSQFHLSRLPYMSWTSLRRTLTASSPVAPSISACATMSAGVSYSRWGRFRDRSFHQGRKRAGSRQRMSRRDSRTTHLIRCSEASTMRTTVLTNLPEVLRSRAKCIGSLWAQRRPDLDHRRRGVFLGGDSRCMVASSHQVMPCSSGGPMTSTSRPSGSAMSK